jgi:hypothetical protein
MSTCTPSLQDTRVTNGSNKAQSDHALNRMHVRAIWEAKSRENSSEDLEICPWDFDSGEPCRKLGSSVVARTGVSLIGSVSSASSDHGRAQRTAVSEFIQIDCLQL